MENKFKNKGFTNIKGFTLVELVIVIAVIAILAGVLIPTFSNIIEKANASNDINLIRNINEVLVINSADNEVPQTKDEFRNVISEYGINDFKNKSKNHIFYYIKEDNISVIWGIKEQRIIYPEYYNYRGEDIKKEINLSSNVVVNQVLNAIKFEVNGGTLYCEKYQDDTRLNKQNNRLTEADGYVATGAIMINMSNIEALSIYISGVEIPEENKSGFCQMHIFKNNDINHPDVIDNLHVGLKNASCGFEVLKISKEYYKITFDVEVLKNFASSNGELCNVYYVLSLKGNGANLIITHNEEIYN